jgi:ATP-dependent protease HslVU (ClpYQ) peptidase subunit
VTCIVGIAEEGKVYLGGDSAGVSGLDINVRKDRKVFNNGEFVMGFTSSFRMGQILQYDFVPPKVDEDDVMRYMVKKFIPEVRKCLKDAGYTTVSNNVETGGTFLVGVRGRLFEIHSDFQVGETVIGFSACGCGESYALGSLYTSTGSPEERLEEALEAATQFSAGVCGPFYFVST